MLFRQNPSLELRVLELVFFVSKKTFLWITPWRLTKAIAEMKSNTKQTMKLE